MDDKDDRSDVSVRNPASNPALKRRAPTPLPVGTPSCQHFRPNL